MKILEEDHLLDDVDMMWADHALQLERIAKMKPWQRTSQLPGISALTRKNNLGINLNALRSVYQQDYDFYPQTWLYPKDKAKLKKEWNGTDVLIVKPEASC
jgi:hypothetical protein